MRALKLIRRLTEIVAKAHARGAVHRNLKPSNVLLLPADGGKFTMWVTDFGWGQIAAVRAVERARLGIPAAERTHQTLRGAHTLLYTASQVLSGEPANPRDDVFSLGVIWYQLLCRDPQAEVPEGTAWIEEFEPDGLTPAQSRLLAACLFPNAADRPRRRSGWQFAASGMKTAAAPPRGTTLPDFRRARNPTGGIWRPRCGDGQRRDSSASRPQRTGSAPANAAETVAVGASALTRT